MTLAGGHGLSFSAGPDHVRTKLLPMSPAKGRPQQGPVPDSVQARPIAYVFRLSVPGQFSLSFRGP